MAEPTPKPMTDRGASLSREEMLRYGRHLLLPEVGLEGQQRLKDSSVLVVGAGGLGSPLALYLAAAGVGRLGLVDFDVVDVTNLQRQILYGQSSVGRPKLDAARERLGDLNPHIEIVAHRERLSSENALERIRDYDVVADGTDNFPTRYLVNDACALLGKPNVYASIFRFDGQVSVFDARIGPCYRCLYPDPPPPGLVPSCAEGGVLGVLPGVVGALQAGECLKLLLGVGEPLVGRLLVFDALAATFRELELRKDPACPLCGERASIRSLVDYEQFCGIVPPAEQDHDIEISARELKTRLDRGDAPALIDVREPHEFRIARIPGAQLIPLGALAGRVGELDGGREIVLHCHHGQRSMRALELLRSAGFARLRNLKGGIDAWAREVDPSVPRY